MWCFENKWASWLSMWLKVVRLKFPCFKSFSLGLGLPGEEDPWLYLSLGCLETEYGLRYLRDSVHRRAELLYPLDSHCWWVFKRDWHKYTQLCPNLGIYNRGIPPLVSICVYSSLYLRKHFTLLSEDWSSSAYDYRHRKLDSTLKTTEVA